MKKYPAAIEHEKKLLSAMMLKGGECIPDLADKITAEDFFRPEHKKIFEAILAASNRHDVPLDPLLVKDELEKMHVTIDPVYFHSLIDLEFTTARAVTYAGIIKEKARLRQLIEIGEVLMDKAGREEGTSTDIRAVLDTMLQKADAKESTAWEAVGKITVDVVNRAHNLQQVKDLTGVTTGLLGLNNVTNGLQKSDLIFLAARPSMGKTALALNIAHNAAKSKKIVAVFSLEMSKMQLGTRLMGMTSRVPITQINTGNLSGDDFGRLLSALEHCDKLPMYIDDTSCLTIAALRAKAQKLKRDHGLDLIVIDYVQLMQGSSRSKGDVNRVQEVSEISRNLKGLAKDLDVPVLCLSQLSRQVEMRADKRPQLSDLRESGSLEQDADIVMFLYRDEYYNRGEENQNTAELIIAKNRNGATANIKLYFDKNTQFFTDLTER